MEKNKPTFVIEGMTPSLPFFIFTKLLTAGLCGLFWFLSPRSDWWIFPAIIFSILVIIDIVNLPKDIRNFIAERKERKDLENIKNGSSD